MHITAKVDYAVRTLVELAAVGPDPAKAEFLAKSQVIPPHKFLEAVLSDLRRGGLVNSRRGRTGDTGSLGPRTRSRLRRHTSCRGTAGFDSGGSATGRRRLRGGTGNALKEVWIAVRVNLRAVLENVTLTDVAGGELPEFIHELTADPEAWNRR